MKLNKITDKILTIEAFLSKEECQKYIDFSENLGYELAKLDAGKAVKEVRNNDRVLYISEELAEKLWERVKPFAPAKISNSEAIGLNELFRFYKYGQGHYFKGHHDGSYVRNELEKSNFTFMIYLNDDFEGGETAFREHQIKPQAGLALIFLHKLYHEGSEVLSGVKYVLRSDIMYRSLPK